MAKDTFYFSHDYNSRNDVKIKKLLSKHGILGYGIFWAIIEELYNNANALPTDYECIAFDLRVDKSVLESVVKDFDLFVFDNGFFGSLSVQNRIKQRDEKSLKARESAYKRWSKDANALPTHSECNAIKESKGKENKEKEMKIKEIKEIKEKKEVSDFSNPLVLPFSSDQFMDVWNVLMTQKKWKKKSYAALQASLNKLSKHPETVAIEMMKNTIAGEWQGIFELNKNDNLLKISNLEKTIVATNNVLNKIENGQL